MEKKKTTDEEHDLSYYLGGNEEETSSKTTEQKTDLSLNGKRSGSRKKNIHESVGYSIGEFGTRAACRIITGCSAITAHRERTCSETHQCQDEKEDT